MELMCNTSRDITRYFSAVASEDPAVQNISYLSLYADCTSSAIFLKVMNSSIPYEKTITSTSVYLPRQCLRYFNIIIIFIYLI